MTDDANDVEYVTLEMVKRFGVDAVHIARALDESTDALPDIFCTALKMIERFGSDAVCIAREMVDIADALPDTLYPETWRDIADIVERALMKPYPQRLCTLS